MVAFADSARADPTAAEVAVARKAFAQATELESQKQWAEAEVKLREALAIKETPGLRYHLGFCLEHQGKLVEALVEYDRTDEMLQQGAKAPDVAELLGPARDGVRQRVANVTLKTRAKLEGVSIEIDHIPVKDVLVGKVIPQNPGRRVITASAPGRQPFRRELSLGEGESREIVIDLPELGATKGPASQPAAGGPAAGDSSAGAQLDTSRPGSARTIVLVSELAFTAVALGAGVYFTLEKGKSQDQIDAANAELDQQVGTGDSICQKPTKAAENSCGQLPDLTDQRNRSANLALAGFIGAGVGAAATLTTFLLWKPAPRNTARVQFTPVAAPRAFGLGMSGRF